MQEDEKKVAELNERISSLELVNESLFQLVDTANFLGSIMRQKEDWFRKHFPYEYARCCCDMDVVRTDREKCSIKEFNFLDIAFLN